MKKRICFLYSSLNGFVISTLRALHASGQCQSLDVVHWDRGKTSGNSFQHCREPFANFYGRSQFTDSSLFDFLVQKCPDIVYISGWMDGGYLKALRRFRLKNKSSITVCGIDDQWHGGARQWLGKYYYRAFYKNLFDRIWVAGAPQYHFARQLGHGDREILFNLLSADSGLFKPSTSINRRFVFVGRLEREKGPDILVETYGRLSVEVRRSWPLHIIGDGSLRQELEGNLPSGAILHPYLQPDDLALELAKGGIGCQPSRFEQWGVSIHELALLGFPLIVSSACGAASEFVIDGFNGFYFLREDSDDLLSKMSMCIALNDEELFRYSSASKSLGQRISPEISAHSLLSADAPWRGQRTHGDND